MSPVRRGGWCDLREDDLCDLDAEEEQRAETEDPQRCRTTHHEECSEPERNTQHNIGDGLDPTDVSRSDEATERHQIDSRGWWWAYTFERDREHREPDDDDHVEGDETEDHCVDPPLRTANRPHADPQRKATERQRQER